MAITKPIRNRIQKLKKEFDALRKGKESLLTLIDEAEIPESVYNSNAIENSTLTLQETEKYSLILPYREMYLCGKSLKRRISLVLSTISVQSPRKKKLIGM